MQLFWFSLFVTIKACGITSFTTVTVQGKVLVQSILTPNVRLWTRPCDPWGYQNPHILAFVGLRQEEAATVEFQGAWYLVSPPEMLAVCVGTS